MKKVTRKPAKIREARQFAHNLERNINRLGRQPAKRSTTDEKRQRDNTPPDAA